MSIKFRLTILFTLIVFCIITLFSVSIFITFKYLQEKEFETRLIDKAFKTAELLYDVNEVNETLLQIVDKHDITTLYEEEIIIYNTRLEMIYKSGSEEISLNTNQVQKINPRNSLMLSEGDRKTVGVLAQTKHGNVYVIASAIDKWGLSKENNLLSILAVGIAMSLFVSGLAGYYFSSKALQPISEVIGQVSHITASRLNSRLSEGNQKDEIAQLCVTFNKMLERLEESFLMQKNFVSNASHELRTPLTSVNGQIEVALLADRGVGEYKATLQSIHEDISYLTAIINGLLEIAKVSSDQAVFKMEQIRVDEIIWQIRSEFLKNNPQSRILVSFQNFPEEDSNGLTIFGNESLIKTAFTNLIDNACKFSENHSVELLVIIIDNFIKIVFMDSGKGISKDDFPFIFQPFFRSKVTSRSVGYGIGLSLVEKIVHLHKGKIEVNSTVGVGSIFTITLPTS